MTTRFDVRKEIYFYQAELANLVPETLGVVRTGSPSLTCHILCVFLHPLPCKWNDLEYNGSCLENPKRMHLSLTDQNYDDGKLTAS